MQHSVALYNYCTLLYKNPGENTITICNIMSSQNLDTGLNQASNIFIGRDNYKCH